MQIHSVMLFYINPQDVHFFIPSSQSPACKRSLDGDSGVGQHPGITTYTRCLQAASSTQLQEGEFIVSCNIKV